jgi:hypothetical protein
MRHSLLHSAAALGAGVRQVARGWRWLLAAHACNLALALSMAFLVQDAVRSSLGSSLAGDRMKAGWDSLWYASFSSQARGVAATFRPSVSGAGALLDALDTFFNGFEGLFNGGLEAYLWPVLVAYWFCWAFLSGGFVSMFVSPDRGAGFMTRAALLFPRFLTLSTVGLLGYVLIFGWIRTGADVYVSSRLRDVSDERIHFAWTLGEYFVLWTLVFVLSLALDYAKVFAARAADQPWSPRTMLGVFGRSGRFVGSHLVAVIALYLLTGGIGILLLGLDLAIVPGALDSTPPALVWMFLLGQASILCRITLRSLFYAGEACLAARLADPRLSVSGAGAA